MTELIKYYYNHLIHLFYNKIIINVPINNSTLLPKLQLIIHKFNYEKQKIEYIFTSNSLKYYDTITIFGLYLKLPKFLCLQKITLKNINFDMFYITNKFYNYHDKCNIYSIDYYNNILYISNKINICKISSKVTRISISPINTCCFGNKNKKINIYYYELFGIKYFRLNIHYFNNKILLFLLF